MRGLYRQFEGMVTLVESTQTSYSTLVGEFFDVQYGRHRRYWWAGENRYCIDPKLHTPFNARLLELVSGQPRGRVLDIGAGEGADAIRLAKLGFAVDAIELSAVACDKIERFARSQRVAVNVRHESILAAKLDHGSYSMVLMNGSLHYIQEKGEILTKVRRASAPGALHVVSLFGTATETPPEHAVVPVFPDSEGGVVGSFYAQDIEFYSVYERAKPESSHPGFRPHVHSHLKIIRQLPGASVEL